MSIKYFETVENLEQKIAAGTATYNEKAMAERLGIPPAHMAYKDRGTTYKSFKAQNVDTAKLTRLIGTLKGMGVDLSGFIGGSSPAGQMDGLVQAISDWLQPGNPLAQTQPATTLSNSKSSASGGAGASSRVPSYGGPAAGPNPARNQAVQKQKVAQGSPAQEYADIASALLKPPPYYDRSSR